MPALRAGCPTETLELDAPEGFDSERAWLRMLSYAAAGFPMVGYGLYSR